MCVDLCFNGCVSILMCFCVCFDVLFSVCDFSMYFCWWVVLCVLLLFYVLFLFCKLFFEDFYCAIKHAERSRSFIAQKNTLKHTHTLTHTIVLGLFLKWVCVQFNVLFVCVFDVLFSVCDCSMFFVGGFLCVLLLLFYGVVLFCKLFFEDFYCAMKHAEGNRSFIAQKTHLSTHTLTHTNVFDLSLMGVCLY